jgi:hypothetical protein
VFTARYETESLNIIHRNFCFDPRPVNVRFMVVKKWNWDRFLFEYFGLSSVSIIPLMLHTYNHLHVALRRRTKRRRLETLQKAAFFRKSGITEQNSAFLMFKIGKKDSFLPDLQVGRLCRGYSRTCR